MKLERELMKQIEKRLGMYEAMGEVEYFTRINAGKVQTYYGSYLRLAKRGTPDYIALIRGKQGLIALFIEAKSDTGMVRPDQEKFMEKYCNYKKEDMCCIIIKDIRQLENWIELYAIDTTKEMAQWNQ